MEWRGEERKGVEWSGMEWSGEVMRVADRIGGRRGEERIYDKIREIR